MENGSRFTCVVRLDECDERCLSDADDEVRERERAALDSFCRVLRELGLDARVVPVGRARVRLIVDHPSREDARRLRDRGGGRRKTAPPEGSAIARITDDAERLAWLDAHTPTEGAEALGVSVRTYYRRLADLRAHVEAKERVTGRNPTRSPGEG